MVLAKSNLKFLGSIGPQDVVNIAGGGAVSIDGFFGLTDYPAGAPLTIAGNSNPANNANYTVVSIVSTGPTTADLTLNPLPAGNGTGGTIAVTSGATAVALAKRPGSPGSLGLRLDYSGMPAGSYFTELMPDGTEVTSAVNGVIEFSLRFPATGLKFGGAALRQPYPPAGAPTMSALVIGGAALLPGYDAIGIILGDILSGLGLMMMASCGDPSGYNRFRIYFGDHPSIPALRYRVEVFDTLVNSWVFLGHFVDARAATAALYTIPGYAVQLLIGNGGGGDVYDIDDISVKYDIPFPVSSDLGDGQVSTGFELNSDWRREISLLTNVGSSRANILAVPGSRPGGSGTHVLQIANPGTLIGVTQLSHLQMVARDNNKDYTTSVFLRRPGGTQGLSILLDLLHNGIQQDGLIGPTLLAMVHGTTGAVTIALNLNGNASYTVVALSPSLGTINPGEWLGLRLKVKQFGLSLPQVVVDVALNSGTFVNQPSYSVDFSSSAYWKTASIVGVNTGTPSFDITMPSTEVFVPGTTFTVTGSTGNDGTYTVVSVADIVGPAVRVTVVEPIPSAVADGQANVPPYQLMNKPYTDQLRIASGVATAYFEIDDFTILES